MAEGTTRGAWVMTLRIPGRDAEKRTSSGVNWISEVLNELG
jgi:hypothetical protein